MLHTDAALRCCQMADIDIDHVKVLDEHMNQMPLYVNKVSPLPGRAMIAASSGSQICFCRFYIHGRGQKQMSLMSMSTGHVLLHNGRIFISEYKTSLRVKGERCHLCFLIITIIIIMYKRIKQVKERQCFAGSRRR